VEENNSSRSAGSVTLPVILIAAVVQGWTFYWLHSAIEAAHWPATDPAWLVALYCVALFLPLTAQLLSAHARRGIQWTMLLAIAAGFGYFGSHYGGSVVAAGNCVTGMDCKSPWGYFPFAFVLTVLWLHLLPFLQVRLQTGRWAPPYDLLFSLAWRNVLMLAEAAAFTALFWLLLFLWQQLFYMLGIAYFRELFRQPLFIYPVTALAFGTALHLIGSIERLTSVVLEQILGVLKWLGLMTALLLAVFTFALVIKLPGLVFLGKHAISATWLLWLVAIEVLLLNAAYRDGSVPQPYPRWIGLLLRLVVPLTVIVAITGLYALIVRAAHYGLTVDRVWAFLVAGAALLYAVGYAIAALQRGAWLGLISRVNVAVAVVLIAAIIACLTPMLSPYRLAAESQYRMALAHAHDDVGPQEMYRTPFEYLRFEAGRYGLDKLRKLAALQDHPDAEAIRSAANAALAQQTRWGPPRPQVSVEQLLAQLAVYPTGRSMEPELAARVVEDLGKAGGSLPYPLKSLQESAGLYVDLDGDGVDEFAILARNGGTVYQRRDSRWTLIGTLYIQQSAASWDPVRRDLEAGNFSAILPHWKRLSIGGREFRLSLPE